MKYINLEFIKNSLEIYSFKNYSNLEFDILSTLCSLVKCVKLSY